MDTLDKANIGVDGLFLNADSGFDSMKFRQSGMYHEMNPNIAINYRNGTNTGNIFFDELLYEQRYCIERTNAWMDNF
jgi:hypothetical protein